MNRSAAIAALITVAVVQSGCQHRLMADAPAIVKASSTYVCPATEPDCKLQVRADFDDGTQKCLIDVSDEHVRVKRGHKPFVLWELRLQNASTGREFRFVSNGIDIQGNDPRHDWKDGRPRAHDQMYEWKSVHGRASDLKYDVNLETRVNSSSAWQPCDSFDPRIVNEG